MNFPHLRAEAPQRPPIPVDAPRICTFAGIPQGRLDQLSDVDRATLSRWESATARLSPRHAAAHEAVLHAMRQEGEEQ